MTFPSNNLICGPSNSGKSCFVERLLATPAAWESPIVKIYYCYGVMTENVKNIAKSFPQAMLIEGLPVHFNDPSKMFDRSKNTVLVLDDLSQSSQASPEMTAMMVKYTHHYNVCLM